MRMVFLFITTSIVASIVSAQEPAWHHEILLRTEHGMGGAAIGDLDPAGPGNEVVAVNAAGEVWMARRASGGWQTELIHKGGGEMIMCAVGDVDPRFQGNEFVGVGMVTGEESLDGPGQVVIVRHDAGTWVAEQVFQDSHMVHGVAVGDVSSRSAGNEIVACGFNHRVTLLSFEGGRWRDEVIYVASDRMKIAAVTDALPARDGLEIIVSGSDGQVVLLWEDQLGWKHETIFAGSVGQSRVACAGSTILIGGDDGTITLAQRRDDRWTTEFLARDSGKIRGVAVADFAGTIPSAEYYAGGYSREIRQLWQDADRFWHSKTIFTEERPLHHLIAGEIDERHAGPELVTCGHSGRLIVIYPPG